MKGLGRFGLPTRPLFLFAHGVHKARVVAETRLSNRSTALDRRGASGQRKGRAGYGVSLMNCRMSFAFPVRLNIRDNAVFFPHHATGKPRGLKKLYKQ